MLFVAAEAAGSIPVLAAVLSAFVNVLSEIWSRDDKYNIFVPIMCLVIDILRGNEKFCIF